MGRDTEHPGDTQIRTWVADDQYGVIREIAAARRVTVSRVVRDLIAAGLETDGQRQALDQALKQVTSALDHLERLVFLAVQTGTFLMVSKEQDYRAVAGQHAEDPAAAAEQAAEWIGEIQGMAHERIRKALRGPNRLRKEVSSRDDQTDESAD